MNPFYACMAAALAVLVLTLPAVAWSQRPGPFPLPPPGPLDDPPQPNNETESALVGSWVGYAECDDVPGYYHLQFFKHATGTFQDKQGNYLNLHRSDWSARSDDGVNVILTIGENIWECSLAPDGSNFFVKASDGEGGMYFFRNP